LVLTGMFLNKEDRIFKILNEIEKSLQKKNISKNGFTKPWTAPVPPLVETQRKWVEFPADKDSPAAVVIGWRGPAINDYETRAALKVLWDYLSESSVSPLEKALVDIDEPYCTDISYGCIDNSDCVNYFIFSNVSLERIKEIEDAFFAVIKRIVKKGFDMKRMATVIS